MQDKAIKLSLFINYFVFAILLNSVGIVILKSQNVYGVDEVAASTLELFKDLPIAIVSFLVASFLPRIGYKKAMLAALAIVTVACICMYFGNSFWSAKMLFASVGVSFALIKVSVYSVIGLVTDGEKAHNSLMSNIEGVFMFGIALAYFLFPAFNTEGEPNAWLNVYWLLAGLSILSFFFLYFAKFEDNYEVPKSDLWKVIISMFWLLGKLAIIVLTIGSLLFLRIKQGNLIWSNSFNRQVLESPINLVILIASIIAISAGIGRILDNYYKSKGVELKDDFVSMIRLLGRLLIIVFVISAFLFVMIEQGIMTWLPTFNKRVLELSENLSIIMASILAISLGIGRIMAGVLTQRVSWIVVLSGCLVGAMAMVYFVLPRAVSADIGVVQTLADIPPIGYAFPLVGLFIAPIYPLLNSVVLSALPQKIHSLMSGLIIIFSAIGGTLGSRLIGILFKEVGAETAFSYTLIPMAILFIMLFVLKNLTDKEKAGR